MNRHSLVFPLAAVIATIFFPSFALSQPGSWLQTQGPPGGNVMSLVVTSSGSLLAGTEEGIHRSTDGGASWKWVSATMTYRSTSALARDSSGAVFAGTGSGTIYKSTDDGVSWESFSSPHLGSIYGLCCRDTATLWYSGWGSGVFMTTDGGAHWQAPDTGLTDKYVQSLFVGPGGFALVGTTTSVFRTTNGGMTWATAMNGLTSSSVYAFAQHPNGSVFAATSAGTFRSTNNGDTWTNVDYAAARSILIDTAGVVVVGNNLGSIKRSTDGGTVWNSATAAQQQAVVTLALSPSGQMFAGSGGMGVYRSTDGGITWSLRRDGLVATTVSALLRTPESTLYAATYGAGLYKTTNGGSSWIPLPTVANAYLLTSLAADDSGKIVVGTWGYGLLRQAGADTSWQTMAYGHFYSIATSPGGVILAGNDGGKVLHSTDYGHTWSMDSVTNQPVFCVAEGGDGYLYAGTFQKGFFRSSDSGKTWTQKNSGLSNLIVRSLMVRQLDVLLAATDGGLSKSTDRGDSWTSVTTGLYSVRCMLSVGTPGIIAGGWKGLSYSSDGGTTWDLVNDGLWPPEVRSVAIDAEGYFYAGMANGGVFRSTAATGAREGGLSSLPSVCTLEQNYPNPFNPRTVVSSQLPVASNVRLVVYDVLGREVAVLVDERRVAGFYQDVFDGKGFASGVYIYRLAAGSFVTSRRMVLLK